MSNWLKFVSASLLLVALSGCRSSMWPDWRHPGDLRYQRNNAALHDPYADNDAGPEVVGGRPREFQKPQAETVRSRYFRDNAWGQ